MSIKYLYLAICAVIASASEIKNFLSGVEPVSYSEEKSNGTVIKCFWFNSDKISVYDLHYLKPDNDYKNTSLKFGDGQILFNLCDNIPNDHSKCTPDTQVVYKTDEQSCTKRLTDVASKGSEWSLINPDDQKSGIKIKMSPGDDSKRVIFEIKCDNSTDMTKVETNSSISDDELIFKFSSIYACPQADFYNIYKIIVEKKYIFGSALILIGLFELFLGQKLVTATIFIFSAAIVVLFVFVFFFQFILPGGVNETVFFSSFPSCTFSLYISDTCFSSIGIIKFTVFSFRIIPFRQDQILCASSFSILSMLSMTIITFLFFCFSFIILKILLYTSLKSL